MDIMTRDATDGQPIIPLHPAGIPKDFIHTNRGEYTSKELEDLQQRDFQTRLFISSLSTVGNCVWMRTHHTDNAEGMTNFTYIRDYYKAARATHNHTSAKATMTALLTAMFAKEESNYCSFATVVASGLSEVAKHTSFEIKDDMVRNKSDLPMARQHLVVLMDVVFHKLSVRRFLLGKNNWMNNCNIFRLVHCDTKGRESSKWPIIYCIFSFFLQVCLTAFVFFQIVDDDNDDENREKRSDLLKYGLWVLASLGSVYSFLIAVPEISSTMEAVRSFYNGQVGFLLIVDVIVNIIIPLALVGAGFIVIVQEKSFIDAVLNTAALLFIPEIDDRLPALLGYDAKAIVENYLIKEAKLEYNKYLKMEDNMAIREKVSKAGLGVQFNDFFITNTIERGRSHQDFALYQPFIVRKDKVGEEIDPSNYITEDCLLRKIEWKYTHWDKDDTTKPRIGYMKIYKLNGEIVEVKYDGKEAISIQDRLYSVPDGVYIITSIVLSSAILKLRLCGSNTAEDFQKAMEYYSLWELTFGAKSLLGKHKSGMRIGCGASKRPDVFTNNPVIDLEDAYNYLNENKRSAPVMSHS